MDKKNVNHPAHYTEQGKVECIDYIAAVILPYQGVVAGDIQNVLKYTWRADNKNGLEDIEKALWYAKHASNLIYFVHKRNEKLLHRAWLTLRVERSSEEEKNLREGMAQVESHLTKRELSCYHKMMNAILDGNLYKLNAALIDFVDAIQEWATIYEEEAKQKRKEGAVSYVKLSNA